MKCLKKIDFDYLNIESKGLNRQSLQDVHITENTQISSVEDGPVIVTRCKDLTIDEGFSWTLENPCSGWIIIANGDAEINGSISMTEKGIELSEDVDYSIHGLYGHKNNIIYAGRGFSSANKFSGNIKDLILTAYGETGGGGFIMLIVKGNLTIGSNGAIEASGADGETGKEGGRINIYYAGEFVNNGTIEADGGSGDPGENGAAGLIVIEDLTYNLNEYQKALDTEEYIYCIEDIGGGSALVGTRDTGKVFLVTDWGENWDDKGVLQEDVTIRCFLKISDMKILAGTGEKTAGQAKIYKSEDGGATWAFQADVGSEERVSCLLKIDENTYLAGTRHATNKGRIYKSEDGGDTWTLVNTLGTSNNIRCLILLSNGHILAGTRGGEVYKSEDGGDTWTLKSTITTKKVRVFFEVGSSGIILAGTWDAKIFRNTNFGEDSWTQVEYWSTYQEIVEFRLVGGNKVLVSTSPRKESGTDTEKHLAISDDGGETWRRIETFSSDDTNSYAIREQNILYQQIAKGWINIPINHFGAT